MEPSKHTNALEGGAVKRRVSKLKPPTNYKLKCASTVQTKRNATSMHSKSFKLSNEETLASREHFEITPDIVSSCDESKVRINGES